MTLIKNVFRPTVANAAAFRRYVVSVTLLSFLIAMGADVADQLIFFTSWDDCFREWSVTAAVVAVIAIPIARSMGRAHLELYLAKAEADRLGRTDPLTGLANRLAFYEAAAQLKGGALALVIADIDRFKRVNDSFGHAAGDEVIRTVGRLMQDALGPFGTVARVGGEEFAFVAAHLPDLRERLDHFRAAVSAETVVVAGKRIQATVSAGLAQAEGADFDALYAAADKALYVAKSVGRDRVVDFEEIGMAAPAPMARAG